MKQLRPRLLDGVAHGVQADHADAVGREDAQDVLQIPDALGMLHVDVDLLGRERGPEDPP